MRFYILALGLLFLVWIALGLFRWHLKQRHGLLPGRLARHEHRLVLDTALGRRYARLPESYACIRATQKPSLSPLLTGLLGERRGGRKSELSLHELCTKESPRLSFHLVYALIWQEDQGFLSHLGFSPREIRIALWDYLARGRRLRGASTITQQLARTLFASRRRSLRRKLWELRLSRLLEERLSKLEIAELYLNTAYFGHNRYGITAASRFYFGKNPGHLSRREGAFLIALLPSPESCRNLRACKNRRVYFRMKRILQRQFSLPKDPKEGRYVNYGR